MHWDSATLVIGLIVLFSLAFSMSNGWNDAANAIATMVSTRALPPWAAVALGAVLNLVGAFMSSKVANTIGGEIADPQHLTALTFLAAVIVAPVWVGICTLRGLPISCSHSLMGGLIGAVLASAGTAALRGAGMYKILFGIIISPLMGFALGYLLMLGISWAFRRMRPTLATALFDKLHVVSGGAMALAHGAGDAQTPMGLIAGALVAGGFVPMTIAADGSQALTIPAWVRVACALTMALGTAMGGWAVMKTLGSGISKLRAHQGFAASAGAATTILVNILARGIPVSTTHSMTGAITGVGATQGVRAVKWGVGRKIVFAWVFTFPACIVGGWLLCWLFRLLHLGAG